MFFDSWYDLLRILVIGICAYTGLVLLLRVTGKRTLSKMNSFDFVVTVALGSTLATILLSKDVSLAEGLLAFAVLCALQFAVTFASVRSTRFQAAVKAEPALVYYNSSFVAPALRRERLTKEEVLAAVRAQGIGELASVEAVVLETDGSLSVIALQNGGSADALRNVEKPCETAPPGDRSPCRQ